MLSGAATIIAGSDIPAWLVEDISLNLERASNKLVSRFGRTPTPPPTLLVTFAQDWKGRAHKGGVNRDVITMHIRGFSLEKPDSRLLDTIKSIVIHEAVHVWNGTMFRSTENSEQSWVHEGAAEYVSNRLWMDELQMKAAMQKALNACRISLGSTSLKETKTASRGRTPYDCGHLVHVIAEHAAPEGWPR